jgi:hypothetical protein
MELNLVAERRNKMDDEIKKLLDEEIKAGLEDLAQIANGTGEKSSAIDDIVKLYRLKTDEAKNEQETIEQAKDRRIKLALETAGIVLPLIFYGIWMRKGLKFEETGTFTSTTFRGLINRFKTTNK